MITIFHGENIDQSRKVYVAEKEKNAPYVVFEANTLTLTDLIQATQSQDLFEKTSKTIFIENFFSKRKAGKETSAFIDVLQKASHDNLLFFWESKELTAKELKLFYSVTIKQFDFPKTLFAFLESIKPGNSKQMLTLFHDCLKTEEPELLFFMMVRQVRMLLACIESSSNTIDEIKRLKPWLKTKLQRQAHVFNKETLMNVYTQLYEIEYEQKTGMLATHLVEAIDFLFISI